MLFWLNTFLNPNKINRKEPEYKNYFSGPMIKLIIILSLLLNYAFLSAQTREGMAVRKFLHDCVAATSAPKGMKAIALQNVMSGNVEGINALLSRPDHEALVKLADLWFRKGIYETGFFHGDLHGGNLFFKDLHYTALTA